MLQDELLEEPRSNFSLFLESDETWLEATTLNESVFPIDPTFLNSKLISDPERFTRLTFMNKIPLLSPFASTDYVLALEDFKRIRPVEEGLNVFRFGQHWVMNVCIVGKIITKIEQENRHTLTIEDGTGSMQVVVFKDEALLAEIHNLNRLLKNPNISLDEHRIYQFMLKSLRATATIPFCNADLQPVYIRVNGRLRMFNDTFSVTCWNWVLLDCASDMQDHLDRSRAMKEELYKRLFQPAMIISALQDFVFKSIVAHVAENVAEWIIKVKLRNVTLRDLACSDFVGNTFERSKCLILKQFRRLAKSSKLETCEFLRACRRMEFKKDGITTIVIEDDEEEEEDARAEQVQLPSSFTFKFFVNAILENLNRTGMIFEDTRIRNFQVAYQSVFVKEDLFEAVVKMLKDSMPAGIIAPRLLGKLRRLDYPRLSLSNLNRILAFLAEERGQICETKRDLWIYKSYFS